MDPSPNRFDSLFRAGDEAWQLFREHRGAAFHAFVPADYPSIVPVLEALRPRVDSFLELGSGVGVITILAGLLGFDAAGIEIDPWLVEQAEDLAVEFESPVTFATGTFIPAPFQEAVDRCETELPTVLDGECGFTALGRDLDEFDLVYAFHWPGLEELFFDLMQRHGLPGGLFLTYGGLDGYRLWRDGSAIDSA